MQQLSTTTDAMEAYKESLVEGVNYESKAPRGASFLAGPITMEAKESARDYAALVVKEKAEVEVEVDKKIEEQERNAGLKRQRDEIKALAKEGMGELKHMSVTVLKTKCAARRWGGCHFELKALAGSKRGGAVGSLGGLAFGCWL